MKLVETNKSHAVVQNGQKASRRPLLTVISIILGFASFATFLTNDATTGAFFGAANLAIIVLYVLFLISLLALIRDVPEINLKAAHLPGWAKKMVIILPLLAVVFAIINAAFPNVSEVVRMSDTDIFQRPGAFARVLFELTSFGLFLSLVPRFLRQKKWIAIGLILLLALVLFVMAGEELSWGQRIFHWQTSGYFATKNQQKETNLHDVHTQLFQNLLFFGGFLLFVVVPFFHDKFTALLQKTKSLKFVVNFLPESWMILAFGAGLVFVDPFDGTYGLNWPSILFQVLATLTLLTVLTIRFRSTNHKLYPAALRTLICAAIVLVLSLSFDRLWNINEGLPTEYIKLFVGFGILTWAIRTRQRVLRSE
jgi:hypothetical protein